MLDLTILGENIKKHRIRMNLSQTQLAAKLLVSFQAVSNWEWGITPPDLENLCKLSVLFGTSLDALMGSFAADSERIMTGVDGGGTKTEFILFTKAERYCVGLSFRKVIRAISALKTAFLFCRRESTYCWMRFRVLTAFLPEWREH